MSLTVRQIRKLMPREKRYSLADGDGLQLTMMPSGRKSWAWRYRLHGAAGAIGLGVWPEMSLAQARAAMRQTRTAIEAGASREAAQIVDKRITLADFGKRWMAEVVAKARKNPRTMERYLERDVYPLLGRRRVAEITGWEVQRLIFARRDAGRPEAAAALRYLLKRLFDYALVCGVIEKNPTDLTPLKYVTQHRSRSRTLSEAELRSFFQGVRNPHLGRLGPALEIMLLTLCRKSELRLARWEHVDLARAEWHLPEELSKSGLPQIFYLSRQAVALFERLKKMAGLAEMVLPARNAIQVAMTPSTLNKAMERVHWGIPHFTPHDLRRTGSTLLNEMGYSADWIEIALGHVIPGIRGIYNRARYGAERRKMLQEWADWLDRLRPD